MSDQFGVLRLEGSIQIDTARAALGLTGMSPEFFQRLVLSSELHEALKTDGLEDGRVLTLTGTEEDAFEVEDVKRDLMMSLEVLEALGQTPPELQISANALLGVLEGK